MIPLLDHGCTVAPPGERGGDLLPKLLRPGALKSEEQRQALRSQAGGWTLLGMASFPRDEVVGAEVQGVGAMEFRSLSSRRQHPSHQLLRVHTDALVTPLLGLGRTSAPKIDAGLAGHIHPAAGADAHRQSSASTCAFKRPGHASEGPSRSAALLPAGVASAGDLGRLLEGLPRPLVDFLKVSAIVRGATTLLGASVHDRLRINATYALQARAHPLPALLL